VIGLAELRRLWEETPASAKQIGEQFGLSRNVVIALAAKHRWKSYTPGLGGKPPPRTMFERLDALHDEMDRVLWECRKRA
jgi:hypothetical protein